MDSDGVGTDESATAIEAIDNKQRKNSETPDSPEVRRTDDNKKECRKRKIPSEDLRDDGAEGEAKKLKTDKETLDKIRNEKLKQIVKIIVSMFSDYLEVLSPDILASAVMLVDFSLMEPLKQSLRLLMQSILKRETLQKSLCEAINALGDRAVRKTLKSSKRNPLPRSDKRYVKRKNIQIENLNDTLINELKKHNLI